MAHAFATLLSIGVALEKLSVAAATIAVVSRSVRLKGTLTYQGSIPYKASYHTRLSSIHASTVHTKNACVMTSTYMSAPRKRIQQPWPALLERVRNVRVR